MKVLNSLSYNATDNFVRPQYNFTCENTDVMRGSGCFI